MSPAAAPPLRAPTGPTALVVAVAAGAADGQGGLAHLVEHLVLRRCHDPAAPWAANGLTGEHLTLYECVTTPAHLDLARATLEAAVLEPLHVTAEEVASELHVIDVESSAERTSAEILGSPAARARITAADVMDFHARHYRPEDARDVVVTTGASAYAAGPPRSRREATRPTLGAEQVHVREAEDLTQVVLTQDGRDAEGAAALLDLARRVEPLLPRRLTLPVETGHRRARAADSGPQLVVSVRLTVRPTVSALAVSVAGGPDPASRLSWIAERLRGQEEPAPYSWGDPVLQARWQAYWDLSVDGGHERVHRALSASPEPAAEAVALVASELDRLVAGDRV